MRENREGEIQRFCIFLWLELEGNNNIRFIKNQVSIDKEISFFNSDDEVPFFPFTCFEIKKVVKKTDNEYIITLNYLEKYTDFFSLQEQKTFKNVPENEYSKMVIKSGLINEDLIDFPSWINTETKVIQNNLNIKTIKTLKKIKDISLNEEVEKICLDTINKNENNNNLEDLKVIIQYNLRKFMETNWYVKVSNELIVKFETINPDSIMIFQYYNSPNDFMFIHVAKTNS